MKRRIAGMHDLNNIGPRIILSFNEGKVIVTESVLMGMILAALIAAVCLWMASGLKKQPSKKQVVAEFIVESIYSMTKKTMGAHNINFAPYIGTIFIFIILGNMLGLYGFRPLTADVNTTFALATLTFVLIQYNSIKSMGLKGKLMHMCEPFPWYIGMFTMFPLKVIDMISQPISLGFRLFGNIFGGVMVMALLFTALGGACHMLAETIPVFHIPLLEAVIPLPANIFFDVFEPIVQAYIFTMLTMVFISMEIIKHGEGEHH